MSRCRLEFLPDRPTGVEEMRDQDGKIACREDAGAGDRRLSGRRQGEAPIPLHQFRPGKEPGQSAERQIRAEGDFRGPFAPADGDGHETDDRAEHGRAHDGEGDGLPAEERANAGDEFHVASPALPRQLEKSAEL